VFRRRKIQAATREVETALLAGRDDELLAKSTAAVARFPEDPELALLHATALMVSHPDEAPRAIAAAIALDTNDVGRVVRAASLLVWLGEVEAARNYLRHARMIGLDSEAVREIHDDVQARLNELTANGGSDNDART
jgi:Flp pilus assembly protein TadD